MPVRWLFAVATVAACGRVDFDPQSAAPSDARPSSDSPVQSQSQYAAAVLADGPVLYWRLDEASGSIAHDRSGHGSDGTYTSCTLGVPGALLDDADEAARFDGASSNVVGPSFPFAGSASFSIEVWLSVDGATDFQEVLNNEDHGGQRSGYAMFVGPTLQVEVERYVNGAQRVAGGPATTIAANEFHYAVGTYDGAALTMYLDGVALAGSADARAAADIPDPFYVGVAETSSFFGGVLDEVAIYDHVLTSDRVAAHYAASGR